MMTGYGQYGSIEMGGMFTVVKIREGLDRNDYKDPGWFKHPEGTVAHIWSGELGKADEAPAAVINPNDTELQVIKPSGSMKH
jgi:hypothetical protein